MTVVFCVDSYCIYATNGKCTRGVIYLASQRCAKLHRKGDGYNE